MATCVHSRLISQVRSRSSSSRNVPNAQVTTVGGLLRPSRQHATILFLCTSRPAPTTTTTSMTPSFHEVSKTRTPPFKLRICSTCLFGRHFRTSSNGGTYDGAGSASPTGLKAPQLRFRPLRASTTLRSVRLVPFFIFVHGGRSQTVGTLPAPRGEGSQAVDS